MKQHLIESLPAAALLALFTSATVNAANRACETLAAENKLAGAVKSSFMKKCEKDATEVATKTCTDQAVEKKLAGAAKSSFVKKCVKDATTAPKE